MTPSVLRDKLIHLWRWGLRPGSAAALIFAVCCFAIASGVHLAFRLVRPDLAAYSTYYAAVFFATIVGGVWSGVVTWVLGGLAAWFVFEPTFLTVMPPLSDEIISLLLYSISCVLIIWGAENYRLVVRRLDVEEHYRRLVVKELNHRIKNKFATVYAVLGNELQAHKDVWARISGRLRALAAADEFLVKSDGQAPTSPISWRRNSPPMVDLASPIRVLMLRFRQSSPRCWRSSFTSLQPMPQNTARCRSPRGACG
jgi:hypothetical protein